MLFKSKRSYSRTECLDAASHALSRGRKKKAAVELLTILKMDPADHVVHGKVAPLLAEMRRYEEAWKSFKAAGEGYVKQGFFDKAMSVYTLASRLMPRETEVWESIVKVQLMRGHRADAVRTLLNAHVNFKSRKLREKAIELLKKAWEIHPWHPEVTYELAHLLAKKGSRKEALELLNGLAELELGHRLRKIRGSILRLSPTPSAAWNWLRAAIAGT